MKKFLLVSLALSMLLSILPTTVSASHWADGDVKYLVENGAIAEDDAMLENLDTPITRSQMVKIIVALLDGDEPIEDKEYFTDISSEDTHIAKAAENGIVNGFGDGTFRPNNPITRQDFFTIVGRAYKLEGEATKEFADADIIADYAKPYVDALQSIGIVNGYGDGTVNPRGNITIAETLAVMHRTDEHVKANTPKEEEKPKPSGGSGGGGGGGFSGGGSSSSSYNPTATFKIEYAEDFTGEYVAYATATVSTYKNADIQKMMLLRDGGYSITGVAGGNPTKQELAEESGQYISEENGKFALPDFGNYELYVIDSNGTLGICPFTVYPPLNNDITAPELNIEVVGDVNSPTYPLTLKVTATDNVGIAKISYLKDASLESTTPSLEMDYAVNVNGRQIITGDTITIDNPSRYTFCAMDVNGHCAYIQVDAFNQVSITDCEYGYAFDKSKTHVALSVELEDDFTGDYVATITPNYWAGYGKTVEETYLVAGKGWLGHNIGAQINWNEFLKESVLYAQESGAVIKEENGVFRVPDFGYYRCYVLNSDGYYIRSEMIEITPPESSDTTPPVLGCAVVDGKGFPRTVIVHATDDVALSKVMYVNTNNLINFAGQRPDFYHATVVGRKEIEGDSFTATEKGIYVICAMDTSGNYTYASVEFSYSGYMKTPSTPESITATIDLTAPTVNYALSTEEDGTVTITTDISDNRTVSESGWFYMSEPYEMDSEEEQVKSAFVLQDQEIDLSKGISEITTLDEDHGGFGSVCILKNYHEANKNAIENKTITATETGAYFIYAKDEAGNFLVVRVDIDNISVEP